MNMISNSTLQVLAEERINNLHRQAEHRRLELSAQGTRQSFGLRQVVNSVKQAFFAAPALDVLEVTEEHLYQAEAMDLPREDLRRREAKRRLYERIAQGNTLIDADNAAHQAW